jgi:tetratricopeptide (TPR) repeat protein
MQIPALSGLNTIPIHVKTEGEVRILPLVVVCTLTACVVSIAFLMKTVWFSVDHERSCQDLKMKAFQSFNRGDWEKASKLYEQAAREAQQSDNPLQLPAILSDLSDAYRQEKDFSKAEEALTSSLHYYERIEKQKSEAPASQNATLSDLVAKRQVEITIKLAKLLEEEGNFSQALSFYTKALAKARSIPDGSDIDSDIEKDYALLLEKSGQISMARQIRANLEANKSGFRSFETQLREGIGLLNQGKIEPARLSFQTASLIAERHQETKDVISAQAWIGACLLAAGQAEPAEKILQKIAASNNKVDLMPEEKKLTLLAISLELQNKLRGAEAYYAKAVALNSAAVVNDLNQRATDYASQGDYASAERLRKRVLCIDSNSLILPSPASLVTRAEKSNNTDLAKHIFFLALIYQKQGNDVLASQWYDADQQILSTLRCTDPQMAIACLMVANYHCMKREFAKAERLYDKAIAQVERSPYKSDFRVIDFYGNAGNNCRASGKHRKSESLYRKELNIFRNSKEARLNHKGYAQCLIDLAGELVILENYGEAKSLLQQAIAEDQKSEKKQQIETAKNVRSLAMYLRKIGYAKQADFICQQAKNLIIVQ